MQLLQRTGHLVAHADLAARCGCGCRAAGGAPGALGAWGGGVVTDGVGFAGTATAGEAGHEAWLGGGGGGVARCAWGAGGAG